MLPLFYHSSAKTVSDGRGSGRIIQLLHTGSVLNFMNCSYVTVLGRWCFFNTTLKTLRAIYLWFMSEDKRADKQQHVNIFNKLISINKYEGEHNSFMYRAGDTTSNSTTRQEQQYRAKQKNYSSLRFPSWHNFNLVERSNNQRSMWTVGD